MSLSSTDPSSRSDEVCRLVAQLCLAPHPEGGFYREVYRSPIEVEHPAFAGETSARRAAATYIHFLLPADEFSAFHRVRHSDELWQFLGGDPLELHTIDAAGRHEMQLLAGDPAEGILTHCVLAGHWQAARPVPGRFYTLCGCTVAPGFDFADFDMPTRADLLESLPQHASVIEELTRP